VKKDTDDEFLIEQRILQSGAANSSIAERYLWPLVFELFFPQAAALEGTSPGTRHGSRKKFAAIRIFFLTSVSNVLYSMTPHCFSRAKCPEEVL
jgi:hypothetical protein